jgi:hypothetical protein
LNYYRDLLDINASDPESKIKDIKNVRTKITIIESIKKKLR